MYRFKASKYKNASPTIAKKEECITEFTVETPVTFGNHATASAKLVAFCVGSAGGGKILVFDINASGRIGAGPTLSAHSDSITAMQFSPFNHCKLATAGSDFTVKIWNLPQDGITEGYSNTASVSLSGFSSRPDCICYHPVAEDILAVSAGSTLFVYNLEDGSKVAEMDTGCDLIQSISWKKDGKFIAMTTKDRRLLICDPRESKVISEAAAHGNHKETRVVWLGETDKVITTGFSNSRVKELKLWNVSEKPRCLQTEDLGSGTGVLMPFYDEDTGMLFVAAKGDSSMTFFEFSNEKEPHIQMAKQELLPNQTKGMCMVPKLGVDAASCEVNRLFQLAQKMLVPIPWKVPRKSLRDFPIDLFPETTSDEPALTAEEWIDGQNAMRNKTTLEPSKRKPLRLGTTVKTTISSAKKQPKACTPKEVKESKPLPRTSTGDSAAKEPTKPTGAGATSKSSTPVESKPMEPSEPVRPKYKPFTGVRASKFRHWKGDFDHPSKHVTNVGPISINVPPSSDVSRCNERYAAVPLKGPGGQMCIIELSKAGRLTEDNSLTLHNSSVISDLQWNPFNQSELAVALESSHVKIWRIPENQFGQQLKEPDLVYKGHESKPVTLCYHPLAENVIASGEVESRVLIWDVTSGETLFELSGDDSEVMSMSWSIDGQYLATSTKDRKLRIYDPRRSPDPMQIGPGPVSTRSSRLAWTCNDKFLAVSGFDKSSSRCVSLHSTSDLSSGPVSTVDFSVMPSVFTVHYDADSSTLFLVGKGDSTMHSLEVNESEPPHLFPLASFKGESPFQSIGFLPKKVVDPRKVEFARGWALMKTTLVPVSFTVPRVKMEYFQDDLFPPTSITWEKTMSATEWVKGTNKSPKKLDLRPRGMKLLSEAPPDVAKPKKYESYDATTYKTDEEKKEELLTAMSGKLDLDKELEQDTMEGVDEDEWFFCRLTKILSPAQ